MIFLAAGTKDGRDLAAFLQAKGYDIVISTATSYGGWLAVGSAKKVREGKLNTKGLSKYILHNNIEIFIDATHPYAVDISHNAMEACHLCAVPYIRYERNDILPEYNQLYKASTMSQAAELAASMGNKIFLSTGSNSLPYYVQHPCLKNKHLIIRVLPTKEVITKCKRLGFLPNQIIAMQGPFSKALNKELYLKYNAEVIITKNGGKEGGTDTKIIAAKELSLPIIVLERPFINYDNIADSFAEVLSFVENKYVRS